MKINKILCLVSIFIIILTGSVYAEDVIDPNIPESWYQAPRLADEMGINEFNESPMLAERVASGELEAVEERLPVSPPVVEPYDKVGKYGGTVNVWGTALDFGSNYRNVGMLPESIGRVVPDGSEIVPLYLKSWEFSDGGKELTLHLREGLKWSDGHPFTSENYTFWFEHEAYNKDITRVPPEEMKPVGILDVSAPDKYTVVFKFDKPSPREDEFRFQNMLSIVLLRPSHFLKQFHPDFVEVEKLEEMAESAGLNTWFEYYHRMKNQSDVHPEWEYQRPTLLPHIAVERTNSTLLTERNPYYPFVDTEGNQLPYIDRIKINLANSRNMAALKMVTGEAIIGARYSSPRDLALYKKNEDKENYSTRIFQRAYGSDVGIQLNLSHKDEKMRELFMNSDFRKALSLAIDRENINEKIYYGLAIPMQASVPPTSTFYKEEYAQAFANFNLERAKELLDGIGMVDKDGDGYRERPDGEIFKPTLIYTETFTDPTPTIELVKNTWNKIGVNINVKQVDRSLLRVARLGNDFDISTWTIDNVTDIGFGHIGHISKAFAPGDRAAFSPFPGYINWFQTGGEKGIEPPAEIKELRKIAEDLAAAPTDAAKKEAATLLLEKQAENVWTIGTVALPPQPILVSNKLKNVPTKGLWDWSLRYMTTYYPIQFYLDE